MKQFDANRRTILKGTAFATALGMAGIIEVLTIKDARAAAWPKAAFDAESLDDTMKALFSGTEATDSGDIQLKAPDIAENGAVVPIGVKTSIPDVSNITILVAENPAPMTASFELGEGAVGDVSTRIKMGKTSDVIALVQSGDKVFAARKNVKVTIGGCGG